MSGEALQEGIHPPISAEISCSHRGSDRCEGCPHGQIRETRKPVGCRYPSRNCPFHETIIVEDEVSNDKKEWWWRKH